ncbi:MAG: phosphatidate cytidylyltransferase [Actinomycetia bacterium]|nr:phosphatidate cytidylyltransferase [Actinomycetes bacterium]MCP4962512.1 phosphatidate cytidylyltransferase [Actinomycetes bacterium]
MDDQDIDGNGKDARERSRRAFSFDDEDSSLPHWAEPATGEMPQIPTTDRGAERSGSRLFPQLPDDPRLADADDPDGIDVGSSLVDGVDDLAPTGPIESIIPSIPSDDLPAPRWASTTPDVEPDAIALTVGPTGENDIEAVDEDTTADAAGVSAWGDESVGSFSDDLDEMLDIGLDDEVDPQPPATDTGPLPIVDVGGDAPLDVGSVVDPPDLALVAPVAADPPNQAETTPPGDDELAAWSVLDDQAPLWREGAQDWGDHDSSDSAERTVLHFDDGSDDGEPAAPSGGRNMPVAIATAVTLIAAFLFLADRGPGYAMILVVPLLVMATSEFYLSVRHVGYRPATLLGLVAVAGLSLATYFEGVHTIPLVLVLATVFSLLWFLFGVEADRPAANISVTLFGIMWVGLLGSFVPLILQMPHGSGILFGAIIGTATYDTAGLLIGRATGQSRLAPSISPNKTYEGLIGGMIFAVLVVTFGLGIWPGLMPWSGGSQIDALLLGIVVAVVAPLGDLAQSLIKRDLGVKDMGTALPGHGGVFDRFDAMLFVIPAVYYLALARDLHLGL